MEQFYNVLQCLLRKERLLARHSDDFEAFIQVLRSHWRAQAGNGRTAVACLGHDPPAPTQANKPLWTMGKRKKPPKLPQQTHSGMRMLYARVTTMQPDEVTWPGPPTPTTRALLLPRFECGSARAGSLTPAGPVGRTGRRGGQHR
eukprot:scaffold328618_cov59-Tisochrysis_lutea.AAC.2